LEKTSKTILLPSSSWKKINPYIKLSGEGQPINECEIGDNFQFLEDLGLFNDTASGELTDIGRAFFESAFIRCDGKEKDILCKLLLQYPPTIAIQQYLWGVKDIKIDQALVVLKTMSFWFYDSVKPLTHFLDLLNYAGIINYKKRLRFSLLTLEVQKRVLVKY